MDPNRRKLAEAYHDQAGTHLRTARERSKSSYTAAEAVPAAQCCVEISVKATPMLLAIGFPKDHGRGEKQLLAMGEVAWSLRPPPSPRPGWP